MVGSSSRLSRAAVRCTRRVVRQTPPARGRDRAAHDLLAALSRLDGLVARLRPDEDELAIASVAELYALAGKLEL